MRTFYKTVATVTIFSVCEKFLGFLYRIFLSKTIGAEGIGLYQVALSVFALLFTVCCSGTPITVSRLMTKYKAQNQTKRVYKIITAGLTFTLLLALPVCLVFLIFTEKFSFLFADPRCINIFRVILPGLVFTSVYAVLRGVFWGEKDFLPYSIIELLEEICMIVSGVLLISFATDIYDGAFRAGVAVLISYVFSFSLAVGVFFIRKNKLANPKSEFKPLLSSAVPITAMRTANSLANSLISIILPLRLISAGFTQSQAMSSFGAAVGQAMPLLFTPTSLISSFTLVLVPEISENYYKGNHFYLKKDVEKAIKFTVFLTCFFIPVFAVCGSEIGIIVFSGHECGSYLSASAFMMLFMSLSAITTSMLNSMGMESKTLFYYIISEVFMLLSVLILPRFCGIYALIIGYAFIYGTTTILNLVLINKSCNQKPKYIKFTLIAILLCLPTILFGAMLEKLLLSALGIFSTLIVCSILMTIFYALLVIGSGLISIDLIKNKFLRRKQKNKPHSKQKRATA